MTAAGERGERIGESVLSLNSGAGALISKGITMPDLPRPAGYWERVARIVDTAPPLTDEQRCVIRAAFHQPEARRAAA
ncbi:hypothetical protein [Streptomyces sp. V3I7]|uniref:hypothetical protein n=1 Tax=Streptomyces sp. V3I7 TaxID=3042278 RepID=UPI0027877CE2|nr:hypothetical protein [Streptomyces sp. V3I7]MDQ0992198.1 hypothetical protein [Streptomyces sp. V3I7]